MNPMQSFIRTVLLRAVVLLPLSIVTLLHASAQQSFVATHIAELSGGNELPPNQESGYALAIFRYDPVARTLEYRITATRLLDTVVGARFHAGNAAQKGSTLGSIEFPATLSTATGTWTLDAAATDAIESDELYLEIETKRHPEGLARGQVTAFYNASAFGMSGQNEIPPAETSTGFGDAILWVDRTSGAAEYLVTWNTLLGHATAVEIARGKPGQTGEVVSHTPVTGTDSSAIGIWTGITDADMLALRTGAMYLNVLTDSFPSGEIRAKIVQVNTFTAAISGANVVPAVTGNAVGTGVLRVVEDANAGGGFAFGTFVIEETSGPVTRAYVRRGAVTENGSQIFPLTRQSPTIWTPEPGYIQPYGPDFDAFFASDTYAEFLTANDPGGEARGQLIPVLENLGEIPAGVDDAVGSAHPGALAVSVDRDGASVRLRIDPAHADGRATVEVVDLRGGRVMKAAVNGEMMVLPAGALGDGGYFVRLIDRDGGTVAVGRFAIAR